MEDLIARLFGNLTSRPGGPMSVRFLLQPTMAALLALRAGLQDARTGQPAYFWALLTNPLHRRELLREGWKAVSKVFVIALVLDVVYQIIQQRWIYPGEALIVAFTLAIVPYLVLRGPVNRLARWWQHR